MYIWLAMSTTMLFKISIQNNKICSAKIPMWLYAIVCLINLKLKKTFQTQKQSIKECAPQRILNQKQKDKIKILKQILRSN